MARLADAMASLTGLVEPARWTDKWLMEKFVKMGMPRKNGDLVLVFQGEFSEAMIRVAVEEAVYVAGCHAYDKMVDMARGGEGREGLAAWANRPVSRSKMPGAPTMDVKQMTLRFRP